jgi:L-ascorbate metabolism protein UlaG (beta-lactamase superfamily)
MNLKGNKVTWFGHGTWLWETSEGKRLMIDPWLQGNPSCPDDLKDPGHIDGVLISHGHFDHTADAVDLITRTGATVAAIFETSVFLEGKGCQNVIGMNKGGTVEVAGVQATMVNAVHSGAILDGETLKPGGDPAGWILEFADGLVVYQAGDTDVFGDMALYAEIYKPTTAVFHIGGHFTMGPRQAAHAVRLSGVTQVISGHFGTFPPLKGTPAELRSLVGSGVEIPDMTPGTTLP